VVDYKLKKEEHWEKTRKRCQWWRGCCISPWWISWSRCRLWASWWPL